MEEQASKPVRAAVLDRILDTCAQYYGVSENDIMSGKRRRSVTDAKRAYCFMARELTKSPFQDIGDHIHVNHATAIYHVRTFKDFLRVYPWTQSAYTTIKFSLKDLWKNETANTQ